MKFSAEVSDVHATADIKGPEVADINNCLHRGVSTITSSELAADLEDRVFPLFGHQSSDILKICC